MPLIPYSALLCTSCMRNGRLGVRKCVSSRIPSSRVKSRLMTDKRLRIRVNPERCQGHARCFALAPELFELDPFGNGRELRDGVVPAELKTKARLAQANCPELAIELIEE